MALVSVVIPTYNRVNWLPRAIQSVLTQTMPDLELIVVDDGSTDNTRQAVAEIAAQDSRLRYVWQANQGRSVARNRGATEANSKYIGVLDSDDEYLPNALASHLKTFAANPGIGMSVGGYVEVDEAGVTLHEQRPWLEGNGLELNAWLFNCYAIPGAVLGLREWYLRIGGYDPQIRSGDDWDHFLQLALHGCSMAWACEVTCRYHQHSGNTVRAGRVNGVLNKQAGMKRAFSKVFSSELLPASVAGLQARATAWATVQIAKMFYLASEPTRAAAELIEAQSVCPELFSGGAPQVLEYLMSPSSAGWGGERPLSDADLRVQLPPELELTEHHIRAAQARLFMAKFFRARRVLDNDEAWRHLWRGLRLDLRWLANPGVLTFFLKRVFGGL